MTVALQVPQAMTPTVLISLSAFNDKNFKNVSTGGNEMILETDKFQKNVLRIGFAK